MEKISTLLLLLFSVTVFGQLKPGFDTKEVKYTIAMCNSYNFLTQYGTTKKLIPKEFDLVFTSDIISMDNKFQIYENGKIGVINYRGSTDKVISWVENCYSGMIPAKGEISIKEEKKNYSFGDSTESAVHAGYALTIVLLSDKIIEQIKLLNKKGIYDIMITGHSQGGALATLTRAYLEHLPKGVLSKKNTYKTYVFASPMCGNEEFALEYDFKFSARNTSFSIVNPKDPVPYLPLHYNEGKLLSKSKVLGWVTGEERFSLQQLGKDALMKPLERKLTNFIKGSNALLSKILSLKFGKIILPEFAHDINYFPAGLKKELPPFEYPRLVLNKKDLENVKLSTIEEIDGKWYKKEPSFFQHKPYNYYVGILRLYDSKSYDKLKDKYLVTDI